MDDTKDTKDIKETGEAASVLSADEQMIQDGFNALLNDYLKSNHRRKVERITKAFNFANQAHAGVKRRSGEPYIMHPIAVARIVCREMGLGSTSICSALLHDVVEDTEYTVEDIRDMFGDKIAQIVDGLTKISGGIFGEQASAQAENFRKLLLTMSDDIRVILIKIADRLHNMRTLGSMLPAKQFKIAGETLYLYAPLAHRLGLFSIKTELEDLSFKYEHPQEYDFISAKLKATEESRNKLFERFAAPVDEKLKSMGLQYEMRARVKSVYSIWNKMESKGVAFEDIYDIYVGNISNDDSKGYTVGWNCFQTELAYDPNLKGGTLQIIPHSCTTSTIELDGDFESTTEGLILSSTTYNKGDKIVKSVAKYAGDKAEKWVEKAIESEKVFKEIKSLIVKGAGSLVSSGVSTLLGAFTGGFDREKKYRTDRYVADEWKGNSFWRDRNACHRFDTPFHIVSFSRQNRSFGCMEFV